MTDLTDSVLSQLNQPQIEAIAQQLGVDPAQAQGAVMQALPLLFGGLARNTASPQGADALHAALAKDHAGVDLGGLLGSVLGGNTGAGESILGHIFGGRRDQAARGLGQTSGLGAGGAGQLLAMLAPLVLGVLGRMNQQQGMTSTGLSGVLGQEVERNTQTGIGGLLSSVFDGDGDGDTDLGDILQAGAGLLGSLNRNV